LKVYHVLAQAQEENVCQSRSPPCSHLCVPLNNLTEDGSLSTTCLCPRDFIKVDEATCIRNSSEELPNTNEFKNKEEEESLNYTLIFSVTGSSVLLIIFIAALTTWYLVRRRPQSDEEDPGKEPQPIAEAEVRRIEMKCLKTFCLQAMLPAEQETPV